MEQQLLETAGSMQGSSGLAIGIFSMIIPVLIWYFGIKQWKPLTRFAYARRFSLWPAMFLSFYLGEPLFRKLFLNDPDYSGPTIVETFISILALYLLLGPLFLLIGWLRGKSLFPDSRPEQ